MAQGGRQRLPDAHQSHFAYRHGEPALTLIDSLRALANLHRPRAAAAEKSTDIRCRRRGSWLVSPLPVTRRCCGRRGGRWGGDRRRGRRCKARTSLRRRALQGPRRLIPVLRARTRSGVVLRHVKLLHLHSTQFSSKNSTARISCFMTMIPRDRSTVLTKRPASSRIQTSSK